MKFRRLFAVFAATIMAMSLAACGSEKDPDDIDEKDFESMAEKLDDMSDEEIEDMFEDYE